MSPWPWRPSVGPWFVVPTSGSAAARAEGLVADRPDQLGMFAGRGRPARARPAIRRGRAVARDDRPLGGGRRAVRGWGSAAGVRSSSSPSLRRWRRERSAPSSPPGARAAAYLPAHQPRRDAAPADRDLRPRRSASGPCWQSHMAGRRSSARASSTPTLPPLHLVVCGAGPDAAPLVEAGLRLDGGSTSWTRAVRGCVKSASPERGCSMPTRPRPRMTSGAGDGDRGDGDELRLPARCRLRRRLPGPRHRLISGILGPRDRT